MVILLVGMMGLRHEVGGDWVVYLSYLESIQGESLKALLTTNEPGYLFLNWLGANVWGGIYTVNTLSAALLVWGLLAFSRCQPRPLLAMLVALPYLLMVVGMGYTRQSVAIGLVMLAMAAVFHGRVWRYIAWVMLAALFHKTAVVMLPFAFFALRRNKLLYGMLMVLAGGLLSTLLLPYADYFVQGYVANDYESGGALVRLLMTVGPSLVFLLYRRRFGFSISVQSFWAALSWSSVVLLLLLLWFPENSTAIDRLALYWLPLQLMVLSHLPGIWVFKGFGRSFGTLMVVAYSVLLMLGWLLFATHAHAWLPYQFYPWVWLWS
ncbi:EpsG family protein [Limnohabitans sp. Hippo3]|uniref:EpsG family protein n=1 Tax=Limnohabitans sp. Hippo3 TaxID=1597956 RepID=UPI000D3656AC|nr:EpsG family protein [Limnohabitans sp. Hippo3]PUE35188.1 hypothetical protein B9Z34_14165 [Limnohabitans sp. Hippo3]